MLPFKPLDWIAQPLTVTFQYIHETCMHGAETFLEIQRLTALLHASLLFTILFFFQFETVF